MSLAGIAAIAFVDQMSVDAGRPSRADHGAIRVIPISDSIAVVPSDPADRISYKAWSRDRVVAPIVDVSASSTIEFAFFGAALVLLILGLSGLRVLDTSGPRAPPLLQLR